MKFTSAIHWEEVGVELKQSFGCLFLILNNKNIIFNKYIFLYDVRHVFLNLFRGQIFRRIGTPRTVSVVHASLTSIQERAN